MKRYRFLLFAMLILAFMVSLTACNTSQLQTASAASSCKDTEGYSFGSPQSESEVSSDTDTSGGVIASSEATEQGRSDDTSEGDDSSYADTDTAQDTGTSGDSPSGKVSNTETGSGATTFTYGGITTITASDEALEERESLQESPRNFVWEKALFPITMWILRDNDNQEFPDQWTVCSKAHLTYGSNEVYTLGSDSADCIILYIHGGGYVYSVSSDSAMVTVCDKLAVNLNAQVYIPLYTLAPRGKWHDAYQLFDALYEDLEALGKPIYLLGDSAGGGSALAYTMFRRDRGDTLPEKLILISPWLDLSLSNPDIDACAYTDKVLSPYALQQFGKFWSDKLAPTDPLVSPIYGNLSGLPPTLVFSGTEEIMYPDITSLYEKMTDAGGDISLVCGEQLWHNYVASDIPESDQCIGMMLEFCRMD